MSEWTWRVHERARHLCACACGSQTSSLCSCLNRFFNLLCSFCLDRPPYSFFLNMLLLGLCFGMGCHHLQKSGSNFAVGIDTSSTGRLGLVLCSLCLGVYCCSSRSCSLPDVPPTGEPRRGGWTTLHGLKQSWLESTN